MVVCVLVEITHESHLARIDLNGWNPGDLVSPEIIFTFDDRVRALNGACMLRPGVMAIADCFASPGQIWRVDLADGARSATARIWLADPTMAWDPDGEVAPPPQPGVNGVRYGARSGYLYYTSTAQKVFMRVPVDPVTLDPTGAAQFVAAIDLTDDFCLDEEHGFAYVTRHRGNTLDRVPLEPGHGSEVRHIAGDPFDPVLAGPSSAVWGRRPGETRHGLLRHHRRRPDRAARGRNRPGITAPGGTSPGREGELMTRSSEIVTVGEVSIETYVDGEGPNWGDLRSQLGPRVTTTVIEDASHALFPEQPAAVASAVLGYRNTLTSS